jgi:aryl-alcohol dehydrogenase-like predicted oxidoreductase
MTFGAQVDRAEASRMLHDARDAGINFIDTANVYAAGESERILGALLNGRRTEIVLASKIGMKVGEEPPGLSRQALTSAVENSLKRLRTDFLDICYLHQPDAGVPMDESLAAMDALVSAGKVRYPASSNFASWQVCRMFWLAESSGYAPARIAQPMYNLLARRIEDEFLPACAALGISTIVYNPLAGGLLIGKHRGGQPLAGTRFDGNQAYLDRYWNDQTLCAVDHLGKAASAAGRSLLSLSLNWLAHHTPANCLVLGASRAEQLCENLRTLEDGPLDAETLSTCDQVWAMLKGISPKYNR